MIDLISMLDEMDVPDMRKDITNGSHVRWLLRNLAIRNRDHPKFKEAIRHLQVIAPDGLTLK